MSNVVVPLPRELEEKFQGMALSNEALMYSRQYEAEFVLLKQFRNENIEKRNPEKRSNGVHKIICNNVLRKFCKEDANDTYPSDDCEIFSEFCREKKQKKCDKGYENKNLLHYTIHYTYTFK